MTQTRGLRKSAASSRVPMISSICTCTCALAAEHDMFVALCFGGCQLSCPVTSCDYFSSAGRMRSTLSQTPSFNF
jgi:hypothetical protein